MKRIALAAAAAVVLVAACGGDDDDASSTTSSASSAASTAAAAYPVTLEQVGGPVTIEAAPERIVALGEWTLELLLGLGITPTAFVTYVGETSPWLADRPELASIERIERTADLPIEAVLAQRPDLVVDLAGIDVGLYDPSADASTQLGDVPLLAPPTGTEDSWQERLTHLGAALGLQEEAAAVIERADAELEGALAGYPELAGATATFGRIDPGPAVTLLVNDRDFTRRFLDEELGLTTPPAQAELTDEVYPGAVNVSMERLDLLDAELVMVLFGDDDARAELEDNPVWQSLDAVSRGAVVDMTLVDAVALRSPGPLSLGYLTEDVLPRLAAAIAS